MLYKSENKQAMLDILENRVSGIADCIITLLDKGYVPNKNKFTIMDVCSILIDAYDNIDVLSEEQQEKLDTLYSKVLVL